MPGNAEVPHLHGSDYDADTCPICFPGDDALAADLLAAELAAGANPQLRALVHMVGKRWRLKEGASDDI
jgi:hypothetical protein